MASSIQSLLASLGGSGSGIPALEASPISQASGAGSPGFGTALAGQGFGSAFGLPGASAGKLGASQLQQPPGGESLGGGKIS